MYGLDWIACVLGLIGMYMLTKKQRFGFMVLVFCSLVWLVVGILGNTYGMVAASIIHAIIELIGYLKWKEK